MNTFSDIEQLVQAIINQHDDPLFSIIDQGNGVVQVTPTPLAQAITLTLKNCLYPLLEQFPIHEFNPYINIFFRSVLSTELMESIEQLGSLNKQHDQYQLGGDYLVIQELMTRMHACIAQMMHEFQTNAFKKLIYNAHRASKKNHDGMLGYIDSLFGHYAQLLVLRLDLSYHQGNYIITDADRTHKYREAKSDFKHLLNNSGMNSLFEHMVGYIWSLEYGPDKGFHYHLILFFDGSKVRQDITLAKMVGEYWVWTITKGRGVYWNCNANKNNYAHCGIGMIHYSDTEKRAYLKQAAAYLIKVDHYARMLAPGNGRTFGRGEILPPRTNGAGRPRLDD